MIRENDDNPPGDDPASAGLPDWLDFDLPTPAEASPESERNAHRHAIRRDCKG